MTDPSTLVEARRYRITGLLGRGGFGTVYRARLEGSEGFVKEVAVKLLSDERPPPDVLARFRDEARILGLLRDRNIVSVDPPTQLGGRWAVVMEFVDGVSCRELLRSGPLPPQIGLEIVEEIAHTLQNLWDHPGQDGAPLHLLHRDLKPGNIQLTPAGHVKLLDFGVARADFAQREWNTTAHIGGTIGYIAPERIEGVEGPPGDIYSLGIVLHELVTRRKALKPGEIRPEDRPSDPAPAVVEVMELALRMRATRPADRPDARAVVRACRELRAGLGGSDLREWAPTHVPHTTVGGADDLVGQTLTETLSSIPRLTRDVSVRTGRVRKRSWIAWGLASVLLAGSIGMFLLGLVTVVVAGWVYLARDEPVAARVEPRLVDLAAPPAPEEGSAGSAGSDEAAGADEATGAAEATADDAAGGDEAGGSDGADHAGSADGTGSADGEAGLPSDEVARAGAGEAPSSDDAARPGSGGSEGSGDPGQPQLEPGEVVVVGDAERVVLVGLAGRVEPGAVPAGRWEVRATFGGVEVVAGNIEVAPGSRVTLRCVASFKRCTAR